MTVEIWVNTLAEHRRKPGQIPNTCGCAFRGFAVFRHADNDKLFAMVMDVPKNRLGLVGEAVADILNVRMGSPLPAALLFACAARADSCIESWSALHKAINRAGRGNAIILQGAVRSNASEDSSLTIPDTAGRLPGQNRGSRLRRVAALLILRNKLLTL